MLRTSLIGTLFTVVSFTALAAGIERDAMDTSIAPGDDFWTYALLFRSLSQCRHLRPMFKQEGSPVSKRLKTAADALEC